MLTLYFTMLKIKMPLIYIYYFFKSLIHCLLYYPIVYQVFIIYLYDKIQQIGFEMKV